MLSHFHLIAAVVVVVAVVVDGCCHHHHFLYTNFHWIFFRMSFSFCALLFSKFNWFHIQCNVITNYYGNVCVRIFERHRIWTTMNARIEWITSNTRKLCTIEKHTSVFSCYYFSLLNTHNATQYFPSYTLNICAVRAKHLEPHYTSAMSWSRKALTVCESLKLKI